MKSALRAWLIWDLTVIVVVDSDVVVVLESNFQLRNQVAYLRELWVDCEPSSNNNNMQSCLRTVRCFCFAFVVAIWRPKTKMKLLFVVFTCSVWRFIEENLENSSAPHRCWRLVDQSVWIYWSSGRRDTHTHAHAPKQFQWLTQYALFIARQLDTRGRDYGCHSFYCSAGTCALDCLMSFTHTCCTLAPVSV